MKRIIALLIALLAALSLVACGGEEDNSDSEVSKFASQSDVSDVQNNSNTTESKGDDGLPEGIELPIAEYPFLAALVLPDDAVVTGFDDVDYADYEKIDIIVKPMDADKLAAYMEKLSYSGYTEGDHVLVSPNGNLELIVGSSFVDLGYISLSVYDASGDTAEDWNNPDYAEYTEGLTAPTFKYKIKGIIMEQLTVNGEASEEELAAYKQSLIDAGFELYRDEGVGNWGVSNGTHNIQVNGYYDGVAYIYISVE